ncbi:hypothetical protein HMPREF9103_02758 [Lentilactobacillus parafarraginis F0439]|uniref:Uncharacterized protein n=1 Tax=Lentilactobacillus parafarraginis F0439 TaxID=797515 RepID=G9ZSN9_9LACO|nr:hypothetical protein HMPREF9103_02758 [Lentilactobacillus parafarraginis F0439]
MPSPYLIEMLDDPSPIRSMAPLDKTFSSGRGTICTLMLSYQR